MTTAPASRRARRAAGPAAVLAAALALAACSSAPSDASGTPAASSDTVALTAQLSWIFNEEFAGEYFAETYGYYEEAFGEGHQRARWHI